MVLFRPFDDVNLANLVWLVVGKQLREGHVIAGKGVDTVKDGPARDAVVPVGSEEATTAVRILGDDQIGSPPSNLAGDVSPEVARVRDLSVGVSEELHVLHSECVRGVPLLGRADSGKTIRRHGAVL